MQFTYILFIAAMSSFVIALPHPQPDSVEAIQLVDSSNLGYIAEASSDGLSTASEDDEYSELTSS